MTDEQKLQYARDNYSIGDKISRRGFRCNTDTVIIKPSKVPKEVGPELYSDIHVFYGSSQVYCGSNNIWAVVVSKEKTEPNYEIY